MSLPVNKNSDDYRFYKTLNMDVQLKPSSETSQHYDVQMENGDFVNVSGKKSLYNAIVIAIMTRFNELQDIPLYNGFGCRAHELIKARKTEMVKYEIELFITEVLENMRRIKEINSVELIESENHNYKINYSVQSINDETVNGSVEL
ncbi:hypothetical protein [Methanobrevibacter sp.]|uniref:hypothetical protein n=1 Tax=Methanobrevibacter sp. TaxID=66852 RepID=UPI00388FC6C2